MAGIITGSINLNKIPKDKIIDGEKGKYLNISIHVNDDVTTFDNGDTQQGYIKVQQSKEEREAKSEITYLSNNFNVVWGNGKMPDPVPRDGQKQAKPEPMVETDDLPF